MRYGFILKPQGVIPADLKSRMRLTPEAPPAEEAVTETATAAQAFHHWDIIEWGVDFESSVVGPYAGHSDEDSASTYLYAALPQGVQFVAIPVVDRAGCETRFVWDPATATAAVIATLVVTGDNTANEEAFAITWDPFEATPGYATLQLQINDAPGGTSWTDIGPQLRISRLGG